MTDASLHAPAAKLGRSPIAYSAHTENCTFLLDEDGVCRQIIRRATAARGIPKSEDSAGRCIGAQYVASIDVQTEGGLVGMPKVGAPMLFGYLGPEGRIALVRTGALLRFETKGAPEVRSEPAPVVAPNDFPLPTHGAADTQEMAPPSDIDVDIAVELDQLEDPTHLFRRTPRDAWNYDTSPPPAPRESLPPPPRCATPLPVHRVRLIESYDSASSDLAIDDPDVPTLKRPPVVAARGMLPVRRRG